MNSLLLVLFLASIELQGASSSRSTVNAISLSSDRQDDSCIETIFRFRRTTCKDFSELARSLAARITSHHFVHSLRRGMTVSASTTAGAAWTQRPIPTPTTTPSRKVQLDPRDLTATAVSTNQINLTWTGGPNNSGFYVERAQSPTGPWTRVATVSGSATSCGNGGLKAATTYYYRLFSRNASYSNVASATTYFPLPDGPPSHLVARAEGPTLINLSWTNNTGDATGFKIERCQGTGCSNFTEVATVTAEVTSYQDTGLAPSMSYSYRVQAYNTALKSAYSNIVSFNTARNTHPPTVPNGLIATVVSASRINLTWTPSTSNGSEVGGYNVFQDGARIGSTVGTTYSVKGLEAKTQYCYTLTAFDRSGNASGQSDPACATTKPPDDP